MYTCKRRHFTMDGRLPGNGVCLSTFSELIFTLALHFIQFIQTEAFLFDAK